MAKDSGQCAVYRFCIKLTNCRAQSQRPASSSRNDVNSNFTNRLADQRRKSRASKSANTTMFKNHDDDDE